MKKLYFNEDNKKRKPRTKSYDISFDGVHINGQPIHCNESPAMKKLGYRHSNGLCLGCGKKECQCKSKE